MELLNVHYISDDYASYIINNDTSVFGYYNAAGGVVEKEKVDNFIKSIKNQYGAGTFIDIQNDEAEYTICEIQKLYSNCARLCIYKAI